MIAQPAPIITWDFMPHALKFSSQIATMMAIFRQVACYACNMRNFDYLQEALGYVMTKLRKERGFTNLMLADFSGLQDSYIRGIAKGRRNPSIGAIYAICEALGITVTEFLDRVERKRQEMSRDNEAKKN